MIVLSTQAQARDLTPHQLHKISDRPIADDEHLTSTPGRVQGKSHNVSEEAALTHAVAALSRGQLELGDAVGCFQIEVPVGVVASPEGWPLS